VLLLSVRQSFAIGNVWVACVLVAVLIEQVAHYSLRQPVTWIYLLLAYSLPVPYLARAHARLRELQFGTT
jgi:hypothetical protein